MARIAVSPTSIELPVAFYENADKWVIDESERLHVVGANGNLASYNRGAWATVQFASEPSDNPSSADEMHKLGRS